MKLTLLAATAVLLIGASPAQALPERELVSRYCRGMIKEYRWPDGTRADCISDSHAIEVEISSRWAESLGQALNSAWWTREIAANPKEYPQQSSKIGGVPRKAGIILVCLRPRPSEQTCIDHYTRLYRLLEEQKLPVTIWYCSAEDNKALGDCQGVDFPEKTPLPINPPLPTRKPTLVPNTGSIMPLLTSKKRLLICAAFPAQSPGRDFLVRKMVAVFYGASFWTSKSGARRLKGELSKP